MTSSPGKEEQQLPPPVNVDQDKEAPPASVAPPANQNEEVPSLQQAFNDALEDYDSDDDESFRPDEEEDDSEDDIMDAPELDMKHFAPAQAAKLAPASSSSAAGAKDHPVPSTAAADSDDNHNQFPDDDAAVKAKDSKDKPKEQTPIKLESLANLSNLTEAQKQALIQQAMDDYDEDDDPDYVSEGDEDPEDHMLDMSDDEFEEEVNNKPRGGGVRNRNGNHDPFDLLASGEEEDDLDEETSSDEQSSSYDVNDGTSTLLIVILLRR